MLRVVDTCQRGADDSSTLVILKTGRMFDISWTELLVIAVVALIAIGPKELPRVLYEAGKWARRAKVMAGEFQRHFSDLMHETELDELRKQAQAARDLSGVKTLADLADPDRVIRNSFDPATLGAEGHRGSPPEAEPTEDWQESADAVAPKATAEAPTPDREAAAPTPVSQG